MWYDMYMDDVRWTGRAVDQKPGIESWTIARHNAALHSIHVLLCMQLWHGIMGGGVWRRQSIGRGRKRVRQEERDDRLSEQLNKHIHDHVHVVVPVHVVCARTDSACATCRTLQRANYRIVLCVQAVWKLCKLTTPGGGRGGGLHSAISIIHFSFPHARKIEMS